MWLFHLHSVIKIQPFFSFPLADFMTETFYWLFLWNFKKASTIFYDAAFFKEYDKKQYANRILSHILHQGRQPYKKRKKDSPSFMGPSPLPNIFHLP